MNSVNTQIKVTNFIRMNLGEGNMHKLINCTLANIYSTSNIYYKLKHNANAISHKCNQLNRQISNVQQDSSSLWVQGTRPLPELSSLECLR